jgi:hypothetical protein
MRRSTPCHSLKLPFRFDVPGLVHDLATCTASEWKQHFNVADYSGRWTSIALYSVSGNATDIHTHGDTFRPTALLSSCPYFTEVLGHFQCEKEAVRLLNLGPGSVIHEHRDRGLAYEYNAFRVHIPLHTNPGVDFIVGGKRMQMHAGECWYANFDLPHSVNNQSAEPRVHLVIDCIRNEWSDNLFAQCGYDFELERKTLEPDERTVLAMITELERMNTDTARAMITDLKRKLHA